MPAIYSICYSLLHASNLSLPETKQKLLKHKTHTHTDKVEKRMRERERECDTNTKTRAHTHINGKNTNIWMVHAAYDRYTIGYIVIHRKFIATKRKFKTCKCK